MQQIKCCYPLCFCKQLPLSCAAKICAAFFLVISIFWILWALLALSLYDFTYVKTTWKAKALSGTLGVLGILYFCLAAVLFIGLLLKSTPLVGVFLIGYICIHAFAALFLLFGFINTNCVEVRILDEPIPICERDYWLLYVIILMLLTWYPYWILYVFFLKSGGTSWCNCSDAELGHTLSNSKIIPHHGKHRGGRSGRKSHSVSTRLSTPAPKKDSREIAEEQQHHHRHNKHPKSHEDNHSRGSKKKRKVTLTKETSEETNNEGGAAAAPSEEAHSHSGTTITSEKTSSKHKGKRKAKKTKDDTTSK